MQFGVTAINFLFCDCSALKAPTLCYVHSRSKTNVKKYIIAVKNQNKTIVCFYCVWWFFFLISLKCFPTQQCWAVMVKLAHCLFYNFMYASCIHSTVVKIKIHSSLKPKNTLYIFYSIWWFFCLWIDLFPHAIVRCNYVATCILAVL